MSSMSQETTAAIRASGLVREYAPDRGVCGIDFDVSWGECFALLGRNGSGKSTLTKLLIGTETPDRGEIRVAGRSVGKLTRRDRLAHLADLGIALDTSVHWPKLTGSANSWFIASTYGLSGDALEARLGKLLDEADLSEQSDDHVANYSFGMRRKLSVIEAMCHDPRVLVLDEPTSGVDVQFAAKLAESIADRCKRGLVTWVASNDPDWVAEVATRVAFIDKGRVSAIGTVAELLAEVSSYQEIRVKVESGASVPQPTDGRIQSYVQSEGRITAVAEEDPLVIPSLMEWIIEHGARIESVQVRRSSLRDAFVMKTGEELT
jgi:ABC-2 type transport system ATP-binding protein